MPRRSLRLVAACAVAAAPLVAAVTVTGLRPMSTVAQDTPATVSSSAAVTSLGPAVAVTASPTPTPSVSSSSQAPGDWVYVDCNTGNDGNPGTQAKPFRSIAAATSRTLAPDTVVGLARGCTWDTTVELRGDGTASQPVSIDAYGTGADPVIKGGSSGIEGAIRLFGAYQIVRNVRVTGATGVGILLAGAHSSARNVVIDDVGAGVMFTGTGTSAIGATISDLHMTVNTPGGDDDYGAVGFDVETDDVEISHSSCTNCRASSYDYGHDGGFVEVWNHGNNLYVHDNTGTNTQGIIEVGGNASGSSATNMRLIGNTFTDSHGGVVLHTDDEFAIQSTSVTVSGNTISSPDVGDSSVLDGDMTSVSFTGNRITTASTVSTDGAPAIHRCNSYTLRAAAQLGFSASSTERIGSRASCS